MMQLVIHFRIPEDSASILMLGLILLDFGMSNEEIFKKKKVCDAHFTERDRNRNHRLNNLAIPSLHLNGLNNQRDHSKATYSRTGTVENMHIGCSSISAHNAIAPAFTATDRTESQVQKMVPTGGCSEHFPVTVDHNYCKKAEKFKRYYLYLFFYAYMTNYFRYKTLINRSDTSVTGISSLVLGKIPLTILS
ncbi:uncharacterized protein LOC105382193 isoform X2 [Plutella xylostella]|uniref:uncharacterized protein LOC105382193 isoform X2 n=1 Tax=Plutella xylostella TaxID=51655 RepID=UPI00203296C9|nr:uncharacterized protein LOC105382193 isoform X2 [Plutella xylostella]